MPASYRAIPDEHLPVRTGPGANTNGRNTEARGYVLGEAVRNRLDPNGERSH